MIIASDYALSLVGDAMYRSGQCGALLPAEYYVWRRLFVPEKVVPEPYTPTFIGYDLKALAVSKRLIAGSANLFDEDFFADWGLAKSRVCDYAEEWIELEKAAGGGSLARGMELLLKKFCRELLVPEIERIRKRLFLTADLMRKTNKERELVETTLAAAMSLDAHCHHPFLKRLALESMGLAREALAEGYDLRQYASDEDDEWE